MQPRDDADDADDSSTVEPSRRRGLGFFPEAVVIKSSPYPDGNHHDAPSTRVRPSRGVPNRVPQSYSSWEEWKAWNTGPASTLSHRPPPVFVRPDIVKTGFEQGEEEGFGVDVENDGEQGTKTTCIQDTTGKIPGSDLADWYRSLASKASSSAKQRDPAPDVTDPDAPDLERGAPSVAQLKSAAVDVKQDVKPSPSPLPSTSREISAENSSQPSVTSSAPSQPDSSTPPPAFPAPLRVPASEWFIRRALAKRHATAPAPNPPPKRLSSIGGMLNIAGASTRPPPRPQYVIGPDNVGYTRLSSLGWGGGGLGRPQDPPAGSSSRPRTATPEGSGRSRTPTASRASPKRHSPDGNGLDDLSDLEEERVSGPGRTEPVATALKLDRRGLGSGKADKKVTHTHTEIRRAQQRAGRENGEHKHGAKSKVKWAQKDKKEREERKRLLAALNA